tara:strand:+ start:774 stop:2228 length:1455 start_codon:yes stop_codon:yes gene_type:complete
MIASIRKFSKSFIAKVFVGIIALPFVLWGMGDVFRTGNQNVIAEINNNKISTKEFMEYLQAVNITRTEIQNKGKEKIINEVLTNYISEKIIEMETIKKGVRLTDAALKEILISDDEFKKDGKFLRTKYEKFLLTNGFSASKYEKNILNLESKGQLLSYYSGGIRLPNFLVDDLYKQENKSKIISFIDLEKVYSRKNISESEIKKFYEKNKDFFKDNFRSFRYLELSPEILIGKKNFDETYFKKIEKIENDILDGKSFEDLTSFSKNNIEEIKNINSKKFKKNGEKLEINEKILAEIFKIENLKVPSFFEFDNKYFVAEVLTDENTILELNNTNVRNTIKKQIRIVNLIKENTSIIKKITDKKFDQEEMLEFSKKNNINIQNAKIENINDDSKFNKVLLRQIYNYNSGQIFVVTDYPIAKKNFLIKIDSEVDPVIDIKSEIYKEYVRKANAQYISKVYKSYDSYINAIYKININDKVLERIINSI